LVNTADGSLSARYEYGPFGEPIRISGAISILNPIRFSSKYTDDQSGLVYYGYRYYNPSTGRWMSRDPVAEGGGGINLFVSMNNNPIISYDPVGLRTVSVSLRVDSQVRSPYEWSAPWSRDWVAARLEIEELGGCSISGAPTTEIRGGSRYLWAGPSFIPTTWLYKKKSGKCPCDVECAQLKLVTRWSQSLTVPAPKPLPRIPIYNNWQVTTITLDVCADGTTKRSSSNAQNNRMDELFAAVESDF